MTLELVNDATSKRSEYSKERIRFWNEYATEIRRWQPHFRYYRDQLTKLFGFSIPPGMRILEVGSGTGDILAALRPAIGVGIDFSPEMVKLAEQRHPELHFVEADAHDFDLHETFDIIICSDLINDLWDVQTVFERIAAHCHRSTRVLINFYSNLWEGPRKVAELLGLVKRLPPQNWLTVDDLDNLLYLSKLEFIRHSREIMCPVRVPLLDTLSNRYLVRLWPLDHLGITNVITARLQPDPDLTVMPEDLPRFYDAWRCGRGDFINGVRLVYPMEEHAMRFLNLLGNKFFSMAFSWLLSQSIKDTLCGTKVLSKRDYERIAENRSYFGDFDPFGDFDLIFGAARLNLKIVDMPVRYGERTYGETNIRRWSHGMLLIRMVLLAMRRIKFV